MELFSRHQTVSECQMSEEFFQRASTGFHGTFMHAGWEWWESLSLVLFGATGNHFGCTSDSVW